ncbi:hypothetical protein [Candidatus Paracaedibacter symbiosus]|uniref:hypothetical protein n=1 Tax=Candidatus Paracaedibacter symbiosus TaxID=244582 RepID=UPI000509EA70|nr:hypothetical protein [Candidatus Paracaedibacter symbiosus]
MVSLNLPKNALLMTLSLLSFTASQASYQDLFQEAESEHAQFSTRASSIDYEWDTAKIIMTVGAAGVITFGIGPRVADITNYLVPNLIPSLKWAYERSEIAPLSKLAYAKTQRLRDKLPEVPPLFAPTSSLSMPLSEVVPSDLNKFHMHVLENLDYLLTRGMKDDTTTKWVKKPLYGKFKSAQKSFIDYINFCCHNEDYLFGYHYENSRYVVEIEKFFNKAGHNYKPKNIDCKKEFYRLHRSFKEEGQSETPQYYGGAHEHIHVNGAFSKDIQDLEDISFFIHTFVKSNNFSRKAFKAFFEELLNAWDASQPMPTPHGTTSSSSSSAHQIQIDLRDEASSTILAYLDNERKHLYFLFPTKASENHNILLHFKDKVSHPYTFLYDKGLEESSPSEEEPKLERQKKNKKGKKKNLKGV